MKNLLLILFISVGVKLCYLFFWAFDLGKEVSLQGYINSIFRNDSGWYEIIADNGYREIREKKDIGYSHQKECRQSEWAFFPFYPLLNTATESLLNIDFKHSGLIWSLIFSTLSFWGMYMFCTHFYGDEAKSLYITVLFILFPFHYYFSMM